MNINESIGNYRKNAEKLRGYSYKTTHISAASCPILQTWFKIDAKTQFLYPVVQYTNHLILLFMNVIWNIRNNRKKMQEIKGYTCKITYISAACYPRVANWIPY